jgi:hypothetical protein
MEKILNKLKDLKNYNKKNEIIKNLDTIPLK